MNAISNKQQRYVFAYAAAYKMVKN